MTRNKRKPIGGTIVVGVMSLDEHRRRIEDPDSYRPDERRSCGHRVLHVHDYRERRLRTADGAVARVRLGRFVCHDCGAIWRILPKFICPWLRATWETVDRVVSGAHDAREVHVPTRTAERWRARFTSSAPSLGAVLGSTYAHRHHEIVMATQLDGTQADLVGAFGRQTGTVGAEAFASLADVLSQIRPGTRLMSETGFTERLRRLQPTPPKRRRANSPGKARESARTASGARTRFPPYAHSRNGKPFLPAPRRALRPPYSHRLEVPSRARSRHDEPPRGVRNNHDASAGRPGVSSAGRYTWDAVHTAVAAVRDVTEAAPVLFENPEP
jgi:hypothetical protein